MLNKLFAHLRDYGIREKKTLYLLSLVLLFWALFDGIISYLVPIAITQSGISKTLMGVIVGTSSIAGALFDFVACKLFSNTYYKRLFIIMFGLCLAFPCVLYVANSFLMFVIAMTLWGVYYDLRMIGTFNYIGRFTRPEEHSDNFGVLQVFPAVGYLVAPLMVGFLIADSFSWEPLVLGWIFLSISIFFFIVLVFETHGDNTVQLAADRALALPTRTIWAEVVLWSRVGRILFPVLLLTFFLNFADSFFWTIGPLVAEGLSGIKEFAGVLMTAYALPPLLVGWFVGRFTRFYGKKRSAFFSLFFGSLFLVIFAWIQSPYVLVVDVFLASLCLSMAYPAINGAYADYIDETIEYESEIEGLEDFYTNLGYVVGPMSAGFLADQIGSGLTFSALGMLGVVTALILLSRSPKSIEVRAQLGQNPI